MPEPGWSIIGLGMKEATCPSDRATSLTTVRRVTMLSAVVSASARNLTGLDTMGHVVWSRKMSGALIGIAGAVGALGGVGINLVLRSSYKANQSATVAFWVFLGFYVIAAIITWVFYARREIVLEERETTDIAVDSTVVDDAPAATIPAAEPAK